VKNMNSLRSVAYLIFVFSVSTGALANDLIVLCAGALKPALTELVPAWSARAGQHVSVTYAPAGELLAKIKAAQPADLVVLPSESFESLESGGIVLAVSRRNLGAVKIGIAVAQGAQLPDLSSEAGLRRALLEAKSVTFMDPTRGTSGKYFDEVVLTKLGIRDEVRAKTVLGQEGMLAEKVARGEVEMAVQQISELMPVSGIKIAGELPASLQKTTVYSGAVLATSTSASQAGDLLVFLASSQARNLFAAKGFVLP
jgi:molybdate transport system substrate-binding protein